MKRCFVVALFLMLSIPSVYAVEVIPRIGADLVRQQYSNFDNKSNPRIVDNGFGFSSGIALLQNSFYVDLGVESANVTTPVNSVNIHDKGWRSEMSLSVGIKTGDYFWLNAGYMKVIYGSGTFKNDRGDTSSPFVGFTFSNMEAGGYLFNVGTAFTVSPKHSGIAAVNNPSGGISGGVRLTWRKKGSPHLWAWKHRLYAAGLGGFQDITTKLSYSYLFF